MDLHSDGSARNQLSVRYLGWSSLSITYPDGKCVIVDPNYTPFDGEEFATLSDYREADLMLVSHGHFDHCQDAPAIARSGAMAVITSLPLKSLIVSKGGIDAERVRNVADGDTVEHAGLRVAIHGWLHRSLVDRWPRLLARRPAGLLRMRAALRGLLTSHLLGFRLDAAGVPPLTVIGEAFHGQTDLARVQRLGKAADPGVALIALEPGLEETTADAAAQLAPRAVLAYSAHEVMWRYFGLPDVDAARFRDALHVAAPGASCRVLKPGERVWLD